MAFDSHSTGTTFSLRLLGAFEVQSGGRVVIDRAWPRKKAKALIKLLALQPKRSLHREQVCELLWPEAPPERAATNLRKALHHLRGQLAENGVRESIIEVADGILMLSPCVTADIDQFRESARRALQAPQDPAPYEGALAQYQGDLLPEDLYEEWTIPLREELRTLRCRLLLNAARLYESSGRFELTVARLNQVVEANPLDESACREFIAAYARNGEQVLAMREYEKLRERLERELGARPTRATEQLAGLVQDDRVPPLTGIRIETVISAPTSGAAMPPVRYARTEDAFDIAYWTLGEGPALIDMGTLPHAHLRYEWQIERWREWYLHLARRYQVVRYDSRGIGLSATPNVPEFSTDALVTDLEAVVEALALDQVALFAQFHQGLAAIAYAAKHPERVSHVVLWCCFADGQEFDSQTNVQAMHEVLKGNYALYTEICASTHLDWSDDKQLIGQFGTVIAESARQEVVIAFIEAVGRSNVVDLLPLVRAKTLVLHRSENPWLSADAPKCFAKIRGVHQATLHRSEGTLALSSDPQSALDLIEAFLDESVEHVPSATSPQGIEGELR